jgi:hypothetical protein
MNRMIALVTVASLAGCKLYDVHVKLTPQAEDRRLASGKSDTIKGRLERADATNLYVRVDGEVQAVPRADVVTVDQRLARRDVKGGAIFTALGVATVIGASIVFDCGQNEFPLFCLDSDRNIGAALFWLLGLGLTGAGVKALVSGYAAQSDTDAILRQASRFHIAPTVVRGETSLAPGVGIGVRF